MEEEIGKIEKDDTTNIVLRIDDFGGNPGLTIREFVTSDRYTGFTKAGVRILAKDFHRFKGLVNSIGDKDFKIRKKIDQIIWNAVKGTEELTDEEMKIFNAWYEKEFA